MADPRWPEWFVDVDRRIEALPFAERELLRLPLVDIGRPREGDPRCAHLLFDSDAAPRVLAAIGWLLDDAGAREGDARDELERALFVAAFLIHASAWVRHAVRDPAIRLPDETGAAARSLYLEGRRALADVVGEHSPRLRALDEADAALGHALDHAFGDSGSPEAITRAACARWAAAEIVAGIAAERAGAEAADSLEGLVRAYVDGAELRAELVLMQADANVGRRTGPIALLLEESGMELAGVEAGAQIAAAAFTSAHLRRWIESERGRTEIAIQRAHALGALALGTRLSEVRDDLARLALAAGVAPELAPVTASTSVRSSQPDLGDAVRRAREALLADPMMREAWEVHRWGLFGRPVLTARRFPMALVIEHLAASGAHEGAELSGRLLRDYRDGAYRYFDEPCPMPPDIDTLGAMLRLSAYTAERPEALEILATPLSWVRASMPAEGDVPVWLLRGPRDEGWAESFDALIGGSCVGCQSHLALGLLAAGHGALARPLTSAIARRVERSGIATSAFYGAPYLAYLLAELARAMALEPAADAQSLGAVRVLARRLVDEQSERAPAPQTAALLLLATEEDPARHPARAAWTDRILRTQRADGAWDDAPVYTVPRRGGVSAWYSSRLLTTAICQRALARALHPAQP